jgi:hypothetical protein
MRSWAQYTSKQEKEIITHIEKYLQYQLIVNFLVLIAATIRIGEIHGEYETIVSGWVGL